MKRDMEILLGDKCRRGQEEEREELEVLRDRERQWEERESRWEEEREELLIQVELREEKGSSEREAG